jgi:hypothetical protein
MLTESLLSIANATRRLLRNWSAMMLLAVLYAGLLASLYLFVIIREASAGQVALTLLLSILAPFLFFLLLTAIASQTRSLGARLLLKESLRNFWKIAAVSLPLIALAILVFYLLGRAQTYLGPANADLTNLAERYAMRDQTAGAPPVRWGVTILITIRYLLLGLVLPILAIHLWIVSARDGVLSVIKRMRRLFVRAFAPNSVLIYMAGFLVFGIIPYLLLFSATRSNKAWLEIALFVGRLGLIFFLTLFGWVLTVSALATSESEAPELSGKS